MTLIAKRDARKSTGTFYTPRAITDYLVRRTLGPLVEGAAPDEILALRVLDPAMGSGALLVASCRFLAEAYEAALVRDRGRFACDVTDDERAGFRRLIARRCLYGVDLNPMAVHVARLSMWLATLAKGRPLSFSITISSAATASRERRRTISQPPVGQTAPQNGPLPLFDAGETATLRDRASEPAGAPPTGGRQCARNRAYSRSCPRSAAYGSLRRAADLWCACWFWTGGAVPRPGPASTGSPAWCEQACQAASSWRIEAR